MSIGHLSAEEYYQEQRIIYEEWMLRTRSLDLPKIRFELEKRQSRYSKIKYLEWVIEQSEYQDSIAHFKQQVDDPDRVVSSFWDIPFFWEGMIKAQGSFQNVHTGLPREAFDKGVKQWEEFCMLQDILANLKTLDRNTCEDEPIITHGTNLKEHIKKISSGKRINSRPSLEASPNSFKEIFTTDDWEKYIDALSLVERPVINKRREFIGKQRNGKGVICSWIYELRRRGIISGKYNRQALASVLNNEIEGLHLGKEGKTFDNRSPHYENNYEQSLLEKVALLPYRQ